MPKCNTGPNSYREKKRKSRRQHQSVCKSRSRLPSQSAKPRLQSIRPRPNQTAARIRRRRQSRHQTKAPCESPPAECNWPKQFPNHHADKVRTPAEDRTIHQTKHNATTLRQLPCPKLSRQIQNPNANCNSRSHLKQPPNQNATYKIKMPTATTEATCRINAALSKKHYLQLKAQLLHNATPAWLK